MIPLRDNIPSRTTPLVNYAIVIVCAVVFFMQLAAEHGPGRRHRDPIERFGMVPARVLHPGVPIVVTEERPRLTRFGVRIDQVRHTLPVLPFSPWWTLLTCIFLHGGWLHIIGNMWFLIIFGDNVEDRLGHGKYLIFYLGCGLAGSVAHLASSPNSVLPTVGASGAIAGVMGAYFILYPRARVLTLVPLFVFLTMLDLPAAFFLGVWFVLQFLAGIVPGAAEAGGVAFWAHIGGFVMGVAIALWLRGTTMIRPPVQRRLAMPHRNWP